MESFFAVDAYAKVNLSLAIRGVVSDGFHDIDSVVTTVSLCDTVEIRPSSDGRNRVAYADGRSYDRDNAVIALEALSREYGIPPTECKITKRIPEGVGLGGSSADTAGIIRAVRDFYGIDVAEDFALSLGSDVPCLLRGGCTRVVGRGRIASDISIPQLYMTLVYGNARISTAQAFGLFDELGGDDGDVYDFIKRPFNALERSATAIDPELKEYRKVLLDAGYEHIVMTGSGSGFVGFTDDAEEHARCHKNVNELLTRSGYRAIALKTKEAYEKTYRLPDLPV